MTAVWLTNKGVERRRNATYYSDGSIKTIEDAWTDTLVTDGPTVSKNHKYGQIIQYNYEGEFDPVVEGRRIHIQLLNSANYDSPRMSERNAVSNIHLATAGMPRFLFFKDIQSALQKVTDLSEKQKEASKKADEAKRHLQELEEQRRRDEEKRQRLIQEARDAEERRRIEEDKRKAEEERQRQVREEEERKRQAEEERLQIEKELAAISDKYANAANFIRKQASLRLNPKLDETQRDIKFSHVLDGTTVIIDGGPGTGKTTTLIQRLKLLISEDDLRDYRDNHEDCKLTDEQIHIASDPERNWIFFSPTELLRQFMRDNMNYEGLTDTNNKTVVWADYLRRTLVRDKYQFAGDDFPFDFAKAWMNEKPIYTNNHVTLINRFLREYIMEMKKKLQVVAEIDTSRFMWHQVGKRITEICKDANKRISATSSLVRLMLDLDAIHEMPTPPGIPSAKDVEGAYKEKMQRISTSYMAEWHKDEEFYASLVEMAKNWKNNNLTEEEEEEAGEMDEEEILAGAENKLLNTLKTMMKRLALHTIDKKITLSGRAKQLYEMVDNRIVVADYENLAEYAYFMQFFYPIIHNYEGYLFNKITSIYKNFRREALKTNMAGWNRKLLRQIVEDEKNRPLCQQEQALLIGFINNLVLSIRSVSIRRFEILKHKFALAYKDVCRPVIGIDEATDYTLVDYYAINSLRHYKVSSFTLTGDIMQGLRLDGVSDWMDLQHPYMFDNVEVKDLTISYRQSPKLMRLADAIYEHEMKQPSPYKCKLEQDESCPNPLLLKSDDEEEKAEWIAKRVLEVKQKYGFVPSIAVFVADKQDAAELEMLLKDDGRLENNGIDVKDCSSGDNLSAQDMLRIFPLDKVKGMEFEVVFFHNIDKVKASKLISRYLYVGLSRATFFMGVTTSSTDIDILPEIIDEFDTKGTWGEE
ncbi:MAG: hypothetical protein IKW98_10595 [Prevotella sp.]|nr:hypothetical protein [Prevotella sp.]